MEAPTIIYSRPKGKYSGKDAKRILLDFFVLNTTISHYHYKYIIYYRIRNQVMKNDLKSLETYSAQFFILPITMFYQLITFNMHPNNENLSKLSIKKMEWRKFTSSREKGNVSICLEYF